MLKRKFLLLILILLCSFPVLSQEEEEEKADTLIYGLEEVSIVGTRTKERIIDIPYSVFSVEKKELAFGRKISARNVLADVPGLFIQSRYGNSDLRIAIRGFGTRSNTGVRGVRILQDGIPVSDPDGETALDAIDFTSLGGVEVVKGNLSSLYANAPGGVIDFKTDMNFQDNFISTNNQAGRFGFRQNGFKMGLKDSYNRFFLSYYYRNLDGYRAHSQEYQHLVNAVYEAYMGTRSSITVLGNFVDGFNRLPGSLTKEEYASDPFMVSPLADAFDFRRITKKGRLALKYRTGFGDIDEHELELIWYGGIKELEKSDNLAYTVSSRYSLGALLRYANNGILFGHKNIFTAGMDYAYQSGPVNAFDTETNPGQRGVTVINSSNPNLSNLGFYFLNHFNLIKDKLELFLSSRYDLNYFGNDVFIPALVKDSTLFYSAFTPKIGFNFKLLPDLAVYTSYGLGYDFPALADLVNNPLSSNPALSLNPDIEPQKSRNFEFGIKGNLVNRAAEFFPKIVFDVTFFYYKVEDEIVPVIINQQAFFRNAAKTDRKGVEIGFKTHPIDELEVLINYVYTHFKYDEFEAVEYSPSGVIEEDYSGNFEPSVPPHILNFIVNYELELSEEYSGLLQWDCDYIGELYVNDANSEKAPPFFYGNILAGISYNSDLFGILFYAGVYNIFDRQYVGFVNINDYYGRFYEAGEPRNFYMGLNVSLKL